MSDLQLEPLGQESALVAPAGSRARLLRRVLRDPIGVASLVWLAVVLLAAIFASLLAPYSPTENDLTRVSTGPTWSHLLGTDALGRDLLSRLLYGAWPSFSGVFVAIAVFVAIGVPLGVAAGYLGRWVDALAGRFTEVFLSLPGFILLLVVLTVFGNNQNAAMIALGFLGAPSLVRITRAVTVSVREEQFIAAARVFGLSDLMIIARHVLPRIRSTLIVQTALFSGVALFVQSGLAFLGFGPQPPDPSWGGMVGEASERLTSEPWQILPPGLVIALTVIALGLFGNVVRDVVSDTWSHSQAMLLRRTRRRSPPESGAAAGDAFLEVHDLTVVTGEGEERRRLTRSVTFEIGRGETVGVVGESGCGKTLTSLGLIGVLPPGVELDSGSVYLEGEDVTAMSSDELDRVRGKRIGYVSQEPTLALDPAYTVGNQLSEAVRRHHGLDRRQARARVLELLQMVRLPEPEVVARRYPHQLSGGMAQRVCIALALAGGPELLVADEPTTALDVTTQAEILALLRELKGETGMATLLVTHDWGVVAELCDRAVVMYAGEIVETGPVGELFARPKHPYTAALLRSNPHLAVERNGGAQRGRPVKPLPTIAGEVPRPEALGKGCAFASRCAYATPACREAPIALVSLAPGHEVRCTHSEKVEADVLEGASAG